MARQERGRKLIDAITRGDNKTIDELLSKDVDLEVQIKGDNAIHMAARTGRLAVIKKLKKKGDFLERKNINGNTPLHYAARDGCMDIVKFLHKNYVDMNTPNDDGDTPLSLAVVLQTMDIIEDLVVHYGMDPNYRNKAGQTPLHKAVLFNRQEAMEALIVCGADPNIRDNSTKRLRAEDVAKSTSIRDTLKIYSAMRVAMEEGFIKAKGLKITPEFASQPHTIDRVEIILESIDLPHGFHAAFYCRREKPENTFVNFKTVEDEKTFSDIFHIKVSDVNRDCRAKIYLPLYVPPTEKEEMVLRFINCADEDTNADEYIVRNGLPYCLLETVLIPDTTCICVVNIRPKKEETTVNTNAQVITSDIEKQFTIDIPAGTFEEEAVLSIQVFDASPSSEVFDSDEEIDDDNHAKEDELNSNLEETNVVAEESSIQNLKSTESSDSSEDSEAKDIETLIKTESVSLSTDVYQINVYGDQPKKAMMIQIPLSDTHNTENIDNLVIINVDENSLHLDNAIEVLPKEPRIVNMNLMFEVSHFCLYFGTFRGHTLKKEDKIELQRQVSACKEQRHEARFFAMVRKLDNNLYRHIVVVECCRASKYTKRRKKWLKNGFRDHREDGQVDKLDIVLDEEFYIDIQGNTELQGDIDAVDRKIKFSGVRSSYKYYDVSLKRKAKEGSATVVILKKGFDKKFETVVKVPIVLEVPLPPRPKTAGDLRGGYRPNREEARKNYPSCAQS